MSHYRSNRSRTWPTLVAVTLFAVGAWAVYAWRFAGGSATEAPPQDVAGLDAAHDAAPGAGDDGMTLLRARTPSTPSPDSPAVETPIDADNVVSAVGLAASVSANAPPTGGSGIEISLGPVRPELVATAAAQLQEGRAALARGDRVAARAALSAALDRGLAPADEAFARGELQSLAEAMIFGRARAADDPMVTVHTVGAGDTLGAIAARNKTTPELLAELNGLTDPNRILFGASLTVLRGPFHAVIDKSDHRLDVYLDTVFVRSFRVGLGTNGGTPTGTWAVRTKLVNPEWTDPATGVRYLADDPDNPIGERWIGLHGLSGEALGRVGFGIHGTNDPASIGENMSLGCVRLIERDVAELFDLLVERHSRVVVRD